MRSFAAFVMLVSLCFTSSACEVQSGGDCTYEAYEGVWSITEISDASNQLSLVTMVFGPDEGDAEFPDGERTDFAFCMDAATLEDEALEIGTTWPGAMQVISEGTCAPLVFDEVTESRYAAARSCPETP